MIMEHVPPPLEKQPCPEDLPDGKAGSLSEGSAECLILEGTEGISQGEVFPLDYGQIVTIGRSRTCEICLTRLKKYRTLPPQETKNLDILSISRTHLRLAFYNSQCVELKDLSRNGTFVNGERIKKKIISDIKAKAYEIKLGKRETFKLAWGKKEITKH